MKEKKSDWIHARVPRKMQEPVNQLLELGYTKTEIATEGIIKLCRREGIKA
jgi:hypothetical protein